MSLAESGGRTRRSLLLAGASAAACVGVVVLRFLLPTYDRYDWPIQLISAVRIVHELPYVGVHVLYGPLGHYLLGWFHAASGLEIASAGRLFFALNALLGLALAATLAARWSATGDWRVPALTGLILAGPMAGVASYSGVALNLMLGGTLLANKAARASSPGQPWLASGCGLLVVILALVRINFGVYLGAACGAAFLWGALRHRQWSRLFRFAGALLAAAALAAFVMWRAGFLLAYVRDTFTYVQRFHTRTLPIRAALEQPAYLVAMVGLAVSALWLGARRWVDGERVYMGVLLVGLGSYAWLRFDLVHLYPLVAVLVPLALADAPRSVLHARFRWLGLGCAIVLATAPLRPIVGGIYRLARPDAQRTLESGFALDAGAAGLVAALQSRSARPGDVLVASWPGSCECVSHWCANQAVYLAGRWVPTSPIWIPDTAVTSWADAQLRMIDHLERKGARFVAFEAMRSTDCSDRRVVDPGLLSDWVAKRYSRVASISAPSATSDWYLYERTP